MLLQQNLVDSIDMNIFDPQIFIAELFSICPSELPPHSLALIANVFVVFNLLLFQNKNS